MPFWNALGKLFPAQGGEEEVIGQPGLTSMRRNALMGLGARLLAGSGPKPQGTSDSLSNVGQALGGSLQQWQHQLPEAAQHAAALHQYHQGIQDKAARDAALKGVFGDDPTAFSKLTPEEQTNRLMSAAPVLLQHGGHQELQGVAELVRAQHQEGATPRPEWVGVDGDNTKERLVFLDPRDPTKQTDTGLTRPRSAAASGATAAGTQARFEQKRKDNDVAAYRKEIRTTTTAANAIQRARREVVAESPLAWQTALAALSQADAPGNARMGSMLMRAMSDGNLFSLNGTVPMPTGLLHAGGMTAQQKIQLHINNLIKANGGVVPPSVIRDMNRALDTIDHTLRSQYLVTRDSYLTRARHENWVQNEEEETTNYPDVYDKLAGNVDVPGAAPMPGRESRPDSTGATGPKPKKKSILDVQVP